MNATVNDGGPAFPRRLPNVEVSLEDGLRMIRQYSGMTLRDYFAAKVVQGDIATVERGHDWIEHADEFAKSAYVMADAMLKARQA